MKALFLVGLALFAASPGPVAGQPLADPVTTETIVAIRHGEKPPDGLGNLNCRGLNRALALPKVLLKKFGSPAFFFAPNPSLKKDGGQPFYYVRPLMTIEPTAIRCGLPVNAAFGFTEIDKLALELEKPAYWNSLIFMAWEHGYLEKFAHALMKAHGGDPAQIPAWSKDDFDAIFVFKITRENGKSSIAFHVDHEGLNGLSESYPQ